MIHIGEFVADNKYIPNLEKHEDERNTQQYDGKGQKQYETRGGVPELKRVDRLELLREGKKFFWGAEHFSAPWLDSYTL